MQREGGSGGEERMRRDKGKAEHRKRSVSTGCAEDTGAQMHSGRERKEMEGR